MKRVLILSVCVLLLIAVLIFPASAAELDYNDYITNVSVDGDNDIVTVEIPLQDDTHYSVFDITNGSSTLLYSVIANGFEYPFYFDKSYAVQFIPSAGNNISTDGIPNGTVVSFDVEVQSNAGSYNTPYLQLYMRYQNEDGAQVGDHSVSYPNNTIEDTFPVSYALEIPNGATAFFPTFVLTGFSPLGDSVGGFENVTFTVKSYTLTMSISSLYRLQQSTGKTNQILAEVEKQLEANGQKLDQIINDQVDPESPVGSDIIGDIDDAEGQIRDEAQSGLDEGVDVQQSALDLIIQYASGFAVVGWIFNLFADIPFFSGLLYVSFALGIVSAILGLGLSVVNAGDARGRRSDAYYSRLGRSSRRSKGGA